MTVHLSDCTVAYTVVIELQPVKASYNYRYKARYITAQITTIWKHSGDKKGNVNFLKNVYVEFFCPEKASIC